MPGLRMKGTTSAARPMLLALTGVELPDWGDYEPGRKRQVRRIRAAGGARSEHNRRAVRTILAHGRRLEAGGRAVGRLRRES